MLLEGEPQKAFGHALSLFMELSDITHRMTAVVCNLLHQLDFIYSLQDKNGTSCESFKNVTLISAFSSLADGLALFLILDEILAQNGRIKSYLSLFTSMLNKVKAEVDNLGIAVGDLDCLDQVVSHLEKLLDTGLFQRLLQDELSWVEVLQKVRQNRKFLDACTSCVHDGLSEILPRLDTWKESLFDRKKILHYVALFLFSTYASAQIPEKRLAKVIMEMLQVVPVIYCEGGFRFMLLDLLRSHFPRSLSSWPTLRDAATDSAAAKNNYLKHLNEMYSRDWQSMKEALACWVASFQSTVHPVGVFFMYDWVENQHGDLCLCTNPVQGILLSNRMQMMATSMLDLHALLQVPIRRERLMSLCHMVVLMKVVENTFHKKELGIVQSLPHMINLIQTDIEHSLLLVKDKLLSEISRGSQVGKMRFLSSLTRRGKNTDTRLTDSLSLVLISLRMLEGGGSSKRFFILSTALDVLQSIGQLDIDYSRIKKLISKVEIIAQFQSLMEEVTDCSFLYWRKEMIGTWFSMVYVDVNKFSWLQYLVDAFCDGQRLLKLGHVGKSSMHSLEEEIENAVKNEIIAPLCRDIETDLRLHVHSTHLKGSVHVNPRKTGVRNLSWYLQLKPLRLPFKCIDIKLHVDSYLNSAFYKYTAMSSNDWKIYLDMRQLAGLKYGLVLDEIHLPEHCLDCDVDVAEIMQSLTKFAACYLYNMNNQVFIEKASSSQGQKALRVFCMDHVASSITTHGFGMISAAIDSVLKFLTQKIVALPELLQENIVKTLSVKEFNFLKIGKETTNGYPLARVEEQNGAVKLPCTDDELRFLERLHCIITEMGNVLGLVRVLQAGCSRHVHHTSRFLYKPITIKSYEEHAQKLGSINGMITAGKIMDMAIENKQHAEEHVKCFSSLLTAFSKEFQSIDNLPFRDFYLIIPHLVINLIDSKFNCKDNILRRGRDMGNQITTDDGFVMGVAFVLKVTGQEKSFDGLCWFANASKHLEEQLLSLEESSRYTEQRTGSSGLTRLKLWGQTASPVSTEDQKRIDKLKSYQKELELVRCGLEFSLHCNTTTSLGYDSSFSKDAFLADDEKICFVGVGITDDLAKLGQDHGLECVYLYLHWVRWLIGFMGSNNLVVLGWLSWPMKLSSSVLRNLQV
ncbi:WASH complex subunit 7 [Macleaya cordata]|uniref:WASH complex subunit 7 n=1 Tax=Macleaya cordata TaxID=56857 RepID=A0A200QB99_MACCD|nr:WASH complex subunit 7 [Macleaya cordata]